MYRCESWTIKKAEHQRINAFKLVLEMALETGRRSNQSILKDINPEYSLEGLMMKLKYVDHLMWRADSLEKNPDPGKDWRQEEKGNDREWDGWMASLTQWTWLWANSGRWWRTEKPDVVQSMELQSVGHNRTSEQQLERKKERNRKSNKIRVVKNNRGFPGVSDGKKSAFNPRDLGLISGLGGSLREGNGNPL